VVLQVLIDRDGTVQDAKFMQGSLVFARAAIDAVKQWRFKPYSLNGRAVSVQSLDHAQFQAAGLKLITKLTWIVLSLVYKARISAKLPGTRTKQPADQKQHLPDIMVIRWSGSNSFSRNEKFDVHEN
jgi:hypothetical protein